MKLPVQVLYSIHFFRIEVIFFFSLADAIPSGEDSLLEEEDEDDEEDEGIEEPLFPHVPFPGNCIKRKPDPQLPKTVELLLTDQGSKVYIVGTAHFSQQSQDDVAKVITLLRHLM
jgi:hypothetical protein